MQSLAARETKFNFAFVTIHVKNMQNSIDFYTERLGLRLSKRYGDEFAMLEGPGLTIGLHPAGENGSQAGSVWIGFGVDDVEQERTRLQSRGIEFQGEIIVDPPMRFAYLRDPDGVKLYLAEQAEFS